MAVFTMNMIGLVDLIPPVISHLEDALGRTVASLSVDENSAPGTVVGTVVADASAYSFAIVGGSSTFAISNTGQITVSNNSALDYETTTSLSFQVTASDYANNVSSAFSVTVNINDVDDIPPVISRTTLHTNEVLETISSNTLVAEYTASDAGTDVTANIFISTNPSNGFVVQYSGGTMKLYATSSIPAVVTNQTVMVTLAVVDAGGNVANYNQSVKIIDSTSFTGATLVNANSSFSGRDLADADQMVKVGSYFYGWEYGANTDQIWQLSTSGSINSQYAISHATYSSSGQLGYWPFERWVEAVFSNGSTLFGITTDWVIYRASGSSWVQVGQVGNWVSSLPRPRRGTFMHNGVLYVQTDRTTSGDWKKVTGVSTSSAGAYQASAFPGTVLSNNTSLTTDCDDCTVVTVAGLDYLLLNRKSSHVMVIQLSLGASLGTVYGVEDWENLMGQATGADHDDAFVSNGSYVYTPESPNELWRWDVSNISQSETDYSNPNIPTITSGSASFSVVENTSTSTVLSTYTASGTTPITWSVTGTDASNFNINSSGELRFVSSPDYETVADRSQSINVVATNAVGSASQAVAVTVTNDTSDDPFYFTIPFPTNATRRGPEYRTMYADNSYIYWIGDDSQTSNGGHEHQLVRVGKSGSGMNFYNALASSTDSVNWSFWSGSYFYAKDNPGSSVNGDYLRRFSKTGGSRSSVLMSDNGSYAEDYGDAVVNDNGNYYAYRSGAQVWGKFRLSDGLVTQTYSVSYSHTNLSGAVVINVSGTNYVYALDRSLNLIRRYNAPSGSGTAFSNVGSNSISWPTSNNGSYRGIAYDGSHVWICRGDEIAKFAVPSSASGSFFPSP